MIKKIKAKISEKLKATFNNECLTAYEERKAIYFDSTKLPRGQLALMYKEAAYVVSQRPKWKLIYRLSEAFGL